LFSLPLNPPVLSHASQFVYFHLSFTSGRRQLQSEQVKSTSSHSFTSSATSSMFCLSASSVIYLPAFDAFCLTSSATLPLVARIHKVLLGLGFVHPILVAHIHRILLCLFRVLVFVDGFTTEAAVIKDWRGCATHHARVVVFLDEFKTEARPTTSLLWLNRRIGATDVRRECVGAHVSAADVLAIQFCASRGALRSWPNSQSPW
jgi:hypothetical protein